MRLTGVAVVVLWCAGALAQPKRMLYVTHSAGFRHGSLPVSALVLTDLARRSGRLEVVHTEDVSRLSAAGLRDYDAVFFFTSGELPMSDIQKRELLDWVRAGKGFAGAHSATDTFYQWPEYGELIGARFNGHPWTQSVRIDIEDPDHPASAALQPSFAILEEIYQFRGFSRARSRVLMTLDTRSVNMSAEGVNPGTEDFPLAWVHHFGQGRVFYTALGHFDETWLDERFQRTLLQAMLWITDQAHGEAMPRTARPEIWPDGIANAASFQPRMTASPGSVLSIFGRDLTSGSTMQPASAQLAYKLAGTSVRMNGAAIPLFYVSPGQVNAYVPLDIKPRVCVPPVPVGCPGPFFEIEIASPNTSPARATLQAAEATPGIFTLTRQAGYLTLWATVLGPVERQDRYDVTVLKPEVTIGGVPAAVFFSGLAPGWLGLYQVNVGLPLGITAPALLEFRLGGYTERLRLDLLP